MARLEHTPGELPEVTVVVDPENSVLHFVSADGSPCAEDYHIAAVKRPHKQASTPQTVRRTRELGELLNALATELEPGIYPLDSFELRDAFEAAHIAGNPYRTDVARRLAMQLSGATPPEVCRHSWDAEGNEWLHVGNFIVKQACELE